MNEKRVILSVKKFDKIKSKRHFKKIVWYFQGKKIIKSNNHFYEIKMSEYGKVKKHKELIDNPNEKICDLKCQYKLEIFSKFPTVENISLYLEKINVYPTTGRSFTFFSTEVENIEHLSNLKLLSHIPGVTILKEVDANMYEIIAKKLFK